MHAKVELLERGRLSAEHTARKSENPAVSAKCQMPRQKSAESEMAQALCDVFSRGGKDVT